MSVMQSISFDRVGQWFQKALYKMEFNNDLQKELLGLIGELLEYGLPLRVILYKMLPNVYRKGAARHVITLMQESLVRGESMSSNLEGWFPPTIIMLIAAGEEGNYLDEALRKSAKVLEKKKSAIGAIMSSVTYPLVVFLASVVMVVLFAGMVLPKMLAFFQSGLAPSIALNFKAYADIYIYGWPLMLAVAVLIAFGLGPFLNRYVGPLRDELDRFPVFSSFRDIIASQWMETLGQLNTSGVLMKKAMAHIRSHSKPYLQMHCLRAEKSLREGASNLGSVLDTGLIDAKYIGVLKAVSEIGKLEEKMAVIGQDVYEKTLVKLAKQGKRWGYFLMAVGAINIIFAIFALYVTGSSIGQ